MLVSDGAEHNPAAACDGDVAEGEVEGVVVVKRPSEPTPTEVYETCFKNEADRQKALKDGIWYTHENTEYQSIGLEVRQDTSNLVKLNLRNLSVTIPKTQLAQDIMNTFKYFDEVTLLGIYYHYLTDTLKGEGMMIIDTTAAKRQLQRLIEVPEWGKQYVNVNWKGAPIHCYKCKSEGHIARNCRWLQYSRCAGCNQPGHSANICPNIQQEQQEQRKQQVQHQEQQQQPEQRNAIHKSNNNSNNDDGNDNNSNEERDSDKDMEPNWSEEIESDNSTVSEDADLAEIESGDTATETETESELEKEKKPTEEQRDWGAMSDVETYGEGEKTQKEDSSSTAQPRKEPETQDMETDNTHPDTSRNASSGTTKKATAANAKAKPKEKATEETKKIRRNSPRNTHTTHVTKTTTF
ncbi:hypothetical protein BGX27_001373, partial [Mortierella sp. AM989]